MTTLRLDQKAAYSPSSPKTEAAAKALDANHDGQLTHAEMKAGTYDQKDALFDAMAFEEFMPKLDKYQRNPVKTLLNKILGGNSMKKDWQRAAEVETWWGIRSTSGSTRRRRACRWGTSSARWKARTPTRRWCSGSNWGESRERWPKRGYHRRS